MDYKSHFQEIPVEETQLAAKDFLIPVAHFHQTIFQCFNHPFLFKLVRDTLKYVYNSALNTMFHNKFCLYRSCTHD